MLLFMHADEGSMHKPAEPRSAPEPAEPRHAPEPPEPRGPLSGLVAAGPSKVGISSALRARDVARPRPEDVAAAERDVEIKPARPVGTPSPSPRPLRPGGRPVPRPPLRRPDDGGQEGISPDRS